MADRAVALQPVRCPRCGIRLHDVPAHGFRSWVLALPRREAYAGLGALKLCYGKSCKGQTWLEIVEGPATLVTCRMPTGWVLTT
jgi:hypothetical protein